MKKLHFFPRLLRSENHSRYIYCSNCSRPYLTPFRLFMLGLGIAAYITLFVTLAKLAGVRFYKPKIENHGR